MTSVEKKSLSERDICIKSIASTLHHLLAT